MSQSIKLNDNKFIDTSGVYDSTKSKTQQTINSEFDTALNSGAFFYGEGTILSQILANTNRGIGVAIYGGSQQPSEIGMPENYGMCIWFTGYYGYHAVFFLSHNSTGKFYSYNQTNGTWQRL